MDREMLMSLYLNDKDDELSNILDYKVLTPEDFIEMFFPSSYSWEDEQKNLAYEIAAHVYNLWDMPNRYYHDIDHLAYSLSAFHLLTQNEEDENIITAGVLALWFHDAIYLKDSPTGTGEKESAELLKALLLESNLFTKKVINEAYRCILLTNYGSGIEVKEDDLLANYVIASDLWSLGRDYNGFVKSTREVLLEYLGEDDDELLIVQAEKLEQLFLSKKYIIQPLNKLMRDRNHRATANIRQLLNGYLSE